MYTHNQQSMFIMYVKKIDKRFTLLRYFAYIAYGGARHRHHLAKTL